TQNRHHERGYPGGASGAGLLWQWRLSHRHRLQFWRGYGRASGGSLQCATRRDVCLYGLYESAAVWGLSCPGQPADYLCGGIAHGYAGLASWSGSPDHPEKERPEGWGSVDHWGAG